MSKLLPSTKNIVFLTCACLLAACGGDSSESADSGADAATSEAKAASTQTLLIADIPTACDILTQELAANVLRRSTDEINAMERPGQGLDQPCTWFYASNPAMGIEQQLTLVIAAPPLTYVNSQRDTPEQMQSRLKIANSIREGALDYLGEFEGGRLYAWDGGTRTKMYLATGLRAAQAAGDEPKGEILINTTLKDDVAHEVRIEQLKAVVQAVAEALGG